MNTTTKLKVIGHLIDKMPFILAVALIVLVIVQCKLQAQEPITQEEYITRMVEMGIDAGINSCILKGIPTNRAALEHLKAKSKLLVQTLYPELEWKWKTPQPLQQGDGVTQDSAQTF